MIPFALKLGAFVTTPGKFYGTNSTGSVELAKISDIKEFGGNITNDGVSYKPYKIVSAISKANQYSYDWNTYMDCNRFYDRRGQYILASQTGNTDVCSISKVTPEGQTLLFTDTNSSDSDYYSTSITYDYNMDAYIFSCTRSNGNGHFWITDSNGEILSEDTSWSDYAFANIYGMTSRGTVYMQRTADTRWKLALIKDGQNVLNKNVTAIPSYNSKIYWSAATPCSAEDVDNHLYVVCGGGANQNSFSVMDIDFTNDTLKVNTIKSYNRQESGSGSPVRYKNKIYFTGWNNGNKIYYTCDLSDHSGSSVTAEPEGFVYHSDFSYQIYGIEYSYKINGVNHVKLVTKEDEILIPSFDSDNIDCIDPVTGHLWKLQTSSIIHYDTNLNIIETFELPSDIYYYASSIVYVDSNYIVYTAATSSGGRPSMLVVVDMRDKTVIYRPIS